MFLPQRRLILAATLTALLTACGGGGSSAPAPSNFTVVAGENQAFINWTAEAGVDYWLWFKAGTSVSPGEKTASYRLKVSPPYVLTGLTDATQYAFTVNARKDGGEGGPGATVQTATTRLAGSTWYTGGTLGAGKTLRSVAYGLTASGASTYSYVAVGDDGAIFRTPDTTTGRNYVSSEPLSWITPTGTLVDSSIHLKGVVYASSIAKYVAVGSNGTAAYSADINNLDHRPRQRHGHHPDPQRHRHERLHRGGRGRQRRPPLLHRRHHLERQPPSRRPSAPTCAAWPTPPRVCGWRLAAAAPCSPAPTPATGRPPPRPVTSPPWRP
jgi:hypothetical protein